MNATTNQGRKTMKDKSIFQGIKELGTLRIMDEDGAWGIYEKQSDGAYLRAAAICKINGESNRGLHDRATEFISRDWLEDAGFTR